ncbi:unnamed protein product [Adineta steineri]|uniref:VWFC domain-containing protein n=1 Tax=Adineta steineri TaxID=433720 RepID=A0A815XVY9_9BILA|nr:unnamed protein product [Adineta steineri]CAF1148221.1 unnamed protein product [Adineta steineri]CAF1380169.1 unnamed protein product [Adineta steineri]CAF1562439.1 unnamed protein product [Adineta steineri]
MLLFYLFKINTEWTLTESCQTCKCLSNKIVICRNRTCQMPQDCQMGEQLTIKAGICCPTCSAVQRSCLYDSTAILHNTIFYPKSCLQCRCRDGQLFCNDICRQSILQNRCSFQNELYEINSMWSPLPCIICQCTQTLQNQNVSSVCYIKQCPKIKNCHESIEFIPGQCCPICRTSICHDNTGLTYQNGDVWTRNNNCTHCICKDGLIMCTEEACPILQCKSNEKVVRLSNSCCSICSNRHVCRFYGNKGYQIFYEHDIWYTSACQYCTCRRHNRIICKSIQCEHQFCLENEIKEIRTDSCCVSCRQAKQCNINGHILTEGSYNAIDNCTLCTCTTKHQSECYSNCRENGYEITKLEASGQHRNHTIIITDSSATIISYSKVGTIISSSETNSLLFQFFSSTTTTRSNAAVLLGIIHNSTGQISYRLIIVDFDSTMNYTIRNRSLSDELRLWMPSNTSTTRAKKSSITIFEEDKNSEQIILIILIIILSFICFILILIIIFLCYRQKQKILEPTNSTNSLKRPTSSLSVVEKFHAPDLTTKVTLLSHFHVTESDFGTDV